MVSGGNIKKLRTILSWLCTCSGGNIVVLLNYFTNVLLRHFAMAYEIVHVNLGLPRWNNCSSSCNVSVWKKLDKILNTRSCLCLQKECVLYVAMIM